MVRRTCARCPERDLTVNYDDEVYETECPHNMRKSYIQKNAKWLQG